MSPEPRLLKSIWAARIGRRRAVSAGLAFKSSIPKNPAIGTQAVALYTQHQAAGRSLALALVFGALAAAPVHAADEITALRELIRQQQAVIAAQEQQLKDLARRVDALAAARPAQVAPVAVAPPARPAAVAAAPAVPRRDPTPRAQAVAPVAVQPEAQAVTAAAPPSVRAAAAPATPAPAAGLLDTVAELPRVPVTSDAQVRGMPANPAAAGGVRIMDAENFSVTLGGTLKTVMLSSVPRYIGVGTSFLLVGRDAAGRESQFDLTARYSNLSLAIGGPQLGEWKTGAYFLAAFLQEPSISGPYGFTPGLAYAYATNDTWTFATGRMADTFSPRAPSMVDAYGILGASGNPGNSLRTGVKASRVQSFGDMSITGEVAMTEPVTRSLDQSVLIENNGKPNLEGRLLFAKGPPTAETFMPRSALEIGVSGVAGEFRNRVANPNISPPITTISGGAVDMGLRIGDRFGIQGEVYAGQALGNYLGTILQTNNPVTYQELTSWGGWGEVGYYWTKNLRSYAGYGQDMVSRQDLGPGQVRYNSTIFANLMWSPANFWDLGLEFTWRRTSGIGYLTNSGPAVMATTAFKF